MDMMTTIEQMRLSIEHDHDDDHRADEAKHEHDHDDDHRADEAKHEHDHDDDHRRRRG